MSLPGVDTGLFVSEKPPLFIRFAIVRLFLNPGSCLCTA